MPKELQGDPTGRYYVAYISNCTKASMAQITNHPQGKQGDGMFLSACLEHGTGKPLIDGFEKKQGLGDWFFGSTSEGSAPPVLIDECASTPPYLPCTPGCKHLPPAPAPGPTPEVGAGCGTILQSICGDATSEDSCLQCAKNNIPALKSASCTAALVKTFCGQA